MTKLKIYCYEYYESNKTFMAARQSVDSVLL